MYKRLWLRASEKVREKWLSLDTNIQEGLEMQTAYISIISQKKKKSPEKIRKGPLCKHTNFSSPFPGRKNC